jgi:hypothetical protein
VRVLGYRAPGAEAMITATWTWTGIRNFEENPSGYVRAVDLGACPCRCAGARGRSIWLSHRLVASARVAQPFVKPRKVGRG